MSKHGIVTIEINLDDDFANSCAYHVDYLKETSSRNLRAACEKTETDRWCLIGLANTFSQGLDKAQKIRQELCKMHGVTPYGIEKLLEEMANT